ncbi:hypothetical protein A2U01_0068864, partial [Trifolium medium]|nr:hypothetical protein [Trifolium medium]
ALLGQEKLNAQKSKAELDLQERSTKKIKEGEHEFSNLSSGPKDYSDLVELQSMEVTGEKSYKEMVVGDDDDEVKLSDAEEDGRSDNGEEEEDGIRVEENKIGDY